MKKKDTYDLIRSQQRTDDLRRLNEFLGEIPRRHPDRCGVARTIEYLRIMSLEDKS